MNGMLKENDKNMRKLYFDSFPIHVGLSPNKSNQEEIRAGAIFRRSTFITTGTFETSTNRVHVYLHAT